MKPLATRPRPSRMPVARTFPAIRATRGRPASLAKQALTVREAAARRPRVATAAGTTTKIRRRHARHRVCVRLDITSRRQAVRRRIAHAARVPQARSARRRMPKSVVAGPPARPGRSWRLRAVRARIRRAKHARKVNIRLPTTRRAASTMTSVLPARSWWRQGAARRPPSVHRARQELTARALRQSPSLALLAAGTTTAPPPAPASRGALAWRASTKALRGPRRATASA